MYPLQTLTLTYLGKSLRAAATALGRTLDFTGWLHDRKERRLTADDIDHYCRTLAAMRDTSALLPQLDSAFLPLISETALADPRVVAGLGEKYADED